jgi:aerobic-type carbon monoxide dehydrogenase small subunit (CoxS/CutS family)
MASALGTASGPTKSLPRSVRAEWVRSIAGGMQSSGAMIESLCKGMKPTKKNNNTKPAKAQICLRVNGEPVEVAFAPHKTLLEVLREDLALTGTKHGCELGECGCCAVLVDGRPILSCLALGVAVEGHEVTTVEGMAEGAKLHPLQEAFADLGAAQCGYCTPGFLLTAKVLLEKAPQPSREQIKEALAGNICRCTGYIKIFEAVELAASRMAGKPAQPSKESIYGWR